MKSDSSGQVKTTIAVPTSRLSIALWLREVIRGVVARPSRVALTIAGTVLGTATLVAVLGLTASAQGQVSDRFSILRATEVVVNPLVISVGAGGFPDDAEQRITRLHGVNAAGIAWEVPLGASDTISTNNPASQLGDPPNGISVYAATPGFLNAIKATMTQGRSFDDYCAAHACQAVIVGQVAARRLGVNVARPGQTIFIRGVPFLIAGVVSDAQRNPEVLGGVIIPSTTAITMWGTNQRQKPWMVIDTQVGAANVVGQQVALALRPQQTNAYQVILPPDPRSLQNGVGGDLGSLFLALAGITLLVGAFSIANLTTVAVIERIPEIGLRTALGARPTHIASQFVGESSCLGLIGGLFGTPIGIFTVVIVCLARHWTALLPSWLMATPLLGLIVGFVAGLYPAWRAAHVEPVGALQR